MKLDCPHCGDAFAYNPLAAGRAFACGHCGLSIQMPTMDQLSADQAEKLLAERQATLRKEQKRAEKARKKAEAERQREEKERQRAEEQAAKPPAPPAGTPTSVPSLIVCPDCGHAVSRHAATCPSCGRPMAAQTIEKTSKTFKAMQLFGFLGMALGVMVAAFGSLLASGSSEGDRAMLLGVFAVLGGLVVTILGRGLAWWYHG